MSKTKSYEKSYDRLQEILTLLEKDAVSIDKLGPLVKEASTLVNECRKKLRAIEKEIENTAKLED